MKYFATLAVSLLAAMPLAAAHGFVSQVKIDGKAYKGNVPGTHQFDSPIRTISKQDPVKGANNKAVNCGYDAAKAAVVASANPGSTLEFSWKTASLGNWPHNTGPLMTYLAKCKGACDKFDSAQAQWFKIHEAGRKSNGNWIQEDLMSGKSVTVPLPDDIESGGYLVRHEIIALHLAESKGGAEFYPSCTQINIGGNGNGVPAARDLVSLPGAYSDNDPGIFDKNPYDASKAYPFPGPPIAKLATTGSGSPSGDNDNTNAAPAPSSTLSTSPTGTPAKPGKPAEPTDKPAKPTGSCKMNKKKRSSVPVVPVAETQTNSSSDETQEATIASSSVGKRHYSRVMARIAPHAVTI